MALKILQLQNKLDIAHRSLSELVNKDAEFVTRAAEIEASIPEARDAEAQKTVDEAIEKLDADKAEHEEAKANLQREIEGLEAELRELDRPVDEDKIETVEERKVERPMEIRESREYLHAWVDAVKTGDEREVRSLLTENASGTLAVPTYVEGKIRTAWDNDPFMSRIGKSFVKGNLAIRYEASSSAAVIHTEGAEAPAEEALVLGKVLLTPASIKKWIGVSDEALDMGDEEFVDYIYDELTYRILVKFGDDIVAKINASSLTQTATGASYAAGVLAGIGKLSDEAANPVVICSKATWAAAKAEALNAGYAIDPFAGLPVIFNSTVTGLIVGDLGRGYHANFPAGQTVTVVADRKAKEDMFEFVGRLYVGHDVVAPGCFAKVTISA